VENFSGKTKNAVIQEFYATLALANVCQCFINDADKTIAEESNKKTTCMSIKPIAGNALGALSLCF
jgi:ATP-dependent protease Clp ATPase subunit